ncbi:MAG: NAD(+) synthase [Planctomycetota bacterium]|jgi:NAD+ synthase (glutamine-hydrolysing)|nr:NAD(+) synthase [Planctomycetota bacterium]
MTRIALVQMNPTVGDLEGNAAKMRSMFAAAMAKKAGVAVFPSGALSGAPVLGLRHDRDFRERGKTLLKQLAGEFSRQAFFSEFFGATVNPSVESKLTVRSSALPYYRGSPEAVWREGARFSADNGVWLAECNLVGGQDDVVFAGGSYVAGPDGTIAKASVFSEDILVFDLEFPLEPDARALDDTLYLSRGETPMEEFHFSAKGSRETHPEGVAELHDALVMAIRDYIEKCRLPGAAVSLSGGVDSAVVLALTVDAIGADRVRTLTLPGPFTSADALRDAKLLAENFGVPIEEISIVPAYEAARQSLGTLLARGLADPEDVAGQNLQARIRGMYIMALANRHNYLDMNCSNKSEAMTGYGTLYGDLVGGFSPLCDVWKTDVWNLARHNNAAAGRERIPVSIIERVPSAELRQNQEDRHSLPDYPILDAVLGAFVDRGESYSELLEAGFDRETVEKCLSLHYLSAFKRQQAPMGPCVTGNAAGRWEAPPIVNRFRPW